MARHKILVVDDDQYIIDLLKYNLEKEGFKVKGINDSREAIDAAWDHLLRCMIYYNICRTTMSGLLTTGQSIIFDSRKKICER